MKFSTATILLVCVPTVNAHGTLTKPKGPQNMIELPTGSWTTSLIPWQNMWFNHGSEIGCPVVTGASCGTNKIPIPELKSTPCCEEGMEPTLKNVEQLTYKSDAFWSDWSTNQTIDSSNKNGKLRGTSEKSQPDSISVTTTPLRRNPWLAPGYAPVANSCGILGGWRWKSAKDYIAGPSKESLHYWTTHFDNPINGEMPSMNMTVPAGTGGDVVLLSDIDNRMQEAQGEQYSTNDNPIWKAGSVQEVSYSLQANHGGGFQYRICPLEFLLNDTLDEECFQALDFVGDESWFRYPNTDTNSKINETINIPFTPVRVSDTNTNGVLPKGSTWTQIGLPTCGDNNRFNTCDFPMFQNEISDAGFWGFSLHLNTSSSPELYEINNSVGWEIVDKVKIPEGLKGDYVFSWRWDSEESPQVWTQCSVITVEA